MTIASGTKLGRYEVRAKIGEGGMGEVYLAEDTQLDRRVAIKFLPAESVADEQAKRRLVREAKAAAKLDHPNICSIHEVGESEGQSFIVMQYVEGQTLANRIQRNPMLLRDVLDIAVQVADALAEAHSRGIIHRDIKPQNIIITPRGQAKVMDFGLARMLQPTQATGSQAGTQSLLTEPGTVVGTVPYMSPEQVRGETVDTRSDIFSFGAVLYEMMSGRQPFMAESPAAIFSAILTREPPPLARYSSEVPVELQRILNKVLNKDREERYQTAKDLLVDLKVLKQGLEVEVKLERPTNPALDGEAAVRTSSLPPIGTTKQATLTGEALAARTTSSAEYLIGEIKQHKRSALLVVLLLLLAAVAAIYFAFFARSPAGPIDSIAVLPFVNQNNDPEMEYRSDGLTESIINSLTQLPTLRVIARSSVFRYKGKETDPMAVGKELAVRAVLTGRMLQRGDELSISAELVDVRENKQLWGERYERKVSDLLAVQREIAKEISGNLRLKLSGADESRVTKRYTENPEAYQLYLKGRFYWNKRTGEALKKSIEYFNQAIEKDPSYALAYVGLSDAYAVLPGNSSASPQESFPNAKAAARRAQELDDTLAEAHTSLADALFLNDWNFSEADKEYQRAMALNPNYPTVHHWYGEVYLVRMGRFEEAIAEVKRAQELDPLSLIINADLGDTYILARRYDQAIEQLRKTLEMDPSFYVAHWYLGMAYEMKGSFQEAIAEYRRARQLNDNPRVLALLGHAYGTSGQREEALRTLDQLKEDARQRYVSGFSFALIYAGLGEKDLALQWLEKSYQDRAQELTRLKVDPLLDNLRSDPRFADLVRRVGL